MASPRTAAASPPLPWWATPGNDETCAHCLQTYHYHLEVRCTACDDPLCPNCATRLSIDVVALHCPECATGTCEET